MELASSVRFALGLCTQLAGGVPATASAYKSANWAL